MKQTAVQFIFEELKNRENGSYSFTMEQIYNKAKEMEKQQLIDCGNSCAIRQHIHIEKVNKMSMDEMLEFANTQTITFGEEYYNESFKK